VGSSKYQLQLKRSVLEDLGGIPAQYRRRVLEAIAALASAPRPRGVEKLTGRGDWRIRVGPYRVIYRVDDAERLVVVFRVAHRREAYRR